MLYKENTQYIGLHNPLNVAYIGGTVSIPPKHATIVEQALGQAILANNVDMRQFEATESIRAHFLPYDKRPYSAFEALLTEPEPEPKPADVPDPEPMAVVEPAPEIKSAPEPVSEPESEIKSEPEPVSEPDPEPTAVVEPEPEVDVHDPDPAITPEIPAETDEDPAASVPAWKSKARQTNK